jgi:hypothetical protein
MEVTMTSTPRTADRRRPPVRYAMLVVLVALVASLPTPVDTQSFDPERIVLSPTAEPATSQIVTWRTPSDTGSMAEISPTGGRSTTQVTGAEISPTGGGSTTQVTGADTGAAGAGSYHRATFTGLTADTPYRYRVGDGTTWSEWLTFETAAAGAEPFTFLYLGDVQNDITTGAAPLIEAAYNDPDTADAPLTIHAGDLVNNAGSDSEWSEWFAAFGQDTLAQTNQIAATGNHEYDNWAISEFWNRQFPGTGNGPGDDDLDDTVWYTDYQGVRFIVLNSNYSNAPWFDVEDWLEDQQSWLEGVLENNPNHWTVVSFHQPVIANSEGRSGTVLRRYHWLETLEEHDVDLVLQGHDHSYGRGNLVANRTSDPAVQTGPVYIVTVAGPKMYEPSPLDWQLAGAEARTQLGNTQTYQVIDVDDDTLTYRSKTGDGAVIDAFTITKDGNGKRVTDN